MTNDILIIPIYTYPTDILSPYSNELCAVYLYNLSADTYIDMIIYKHFDKNTSQLSNIDDIIGMYDRLFILQKKYFLQYINQLNYDKLIDIDMLNYFSTNKSFIKYNQSAFKRTPITKHYMNNVLKTQNMPVNCIIPIVKLIEYCDAIKDVFISNIYNKANEIINTDAFRYYNNLYINDIYNIEKNPITINYAAHTQYYDDKYKKLVPFIKRDNRIYSNYEPYTTTGRPSNSNNGFNFNSITESGEESQSFICDNDYILALDYNAYQIRLTAFLIDEYISPTTDAYKWFASLYFKKDIDYVTDSEREYAKRNTLTMLYGGVDKNYTNIPFFKKTLQLQYRLYNKYKTTGYIETFVFGRKIYSDFFDNDSMYAGKLYSYYMQSFETERNILVMNDIINLNKQYPKNKLIMYKFDCFYLDIDKSTPIEYFKQLKQIVEKDGFPCKIRKGKTFATLR